MDRAIIRWCGEYLFVFVALILLKSVFFPFVLWWWFAASDLTTTLQEATYLVLSVIAIFILLGMGSISRFQYRLSLVHTVLAYIAINMPFVILWVVPFARPWADEWWGVLGDGLKLWLPTIANVQELLLFSFGLLLVLVGRFVYVRDARQQRRQILAREKMKRRLI